MEQIKEEKEVFEGLIDKSKQPYEYLIRNIQELENENKRKTRIIEETQKQRDVLFRENEQQQDKIKCMEKDLKAVLSNRKQLDAVENIVFQLVEQEKQRSPKRRKFSPKKDFDVESGNKLPLWATKMISKRKYD